MLYDCFSVLVLEILGTWCRGRQECGQYILLSFTGLVALLTLPAMIFESLTFTAIALTRESKTPIRVAVPVTRMNIVEPYDAPDFHRILPRSIELDMVMAKETELGPDHYDVFRQNKFVLFYIDGPDEEAVEYTFPGGEYFRWSGELVAFRRQNGNEFKTVADFRPGDQFRCIETIRRCVTAT